jgi:hypothetical protein
LLVVRRDHEGVKGLRLAEDLHELGCGLGG